MEAFWMVWNPAHGAPSFRHQTEKEAIAESQRLARTNPGNTFYVLQSIGMARKVDVEYTQIVGPHPF